MDQLLFDLFALQRFADDGALQAVIDEVEDRHCVTALDDEALDGVSGGIELTPLIGSFGKKKQKGSFNNDLTYRGEQVQMGGLVFYGDGSGLTANDLTGRNTGVQGDDNDLISL